MGETTQINFAKNSYKSRSKSLSSQRIVNLYAEAAPDDSPFPVALFGTPGIKEWVDLDTLNSINGTIVMGGDLYVVNGVEVYKVDSNKNITLLGDMPVSPGRVMLTENGLQVGILNPDGTLYVATSSSLTQVTDLDYLLSDSITTLDGFTILTAKPDIPANKVKFFISSLRDMTSYDALEFANAEGEPDVLLRAISDNRELWLFGSNTIQVYFNSANVDFPFERINGAFIQQGCAAKFSPAVEDNAFHFLGNDRIVYQTQGYELRKISSYAIDTEIESYNVVEDAFGFIYTQEGHKFYCLTFPTEKRSWCYDLTTGLWHERQSLNFQRWIANSFSFFAGKNLIGNPESGKIYELDLNTYTEEDSYIERLAASASQFALQSRTTIDRFVLEMDEGTGITQGQGEDPQAMLQWSIDGGQTFSYELWQPIGKIGEYRNKIFWYRLGQGREFIFRIKITDPIKIVILGAYINATVGYS